MRSRCYSNVTGYGHPGYVRSLAEFGAPRELPACGGWLLERSVPDSSKSDLMGPYPLFACQEWDALASDIRELQERVVSVALVSDPFGAYKRADLDLAFNVVRPFKEHVVVDLSEEIASSLNRHHRYEVRRALRAITVERASLPLEGLDEWCSLYGELVQRRGLRGIKALSRQAFAAQLQLPGAVLFRALHRSRVVAAHFWLIERGVAYSHLQASSKVGYELHAAYALYWEGLMSLRGEAAWANLGSGEGLTANGGLMRFKAGWSSARRTAYFCGRVLDSAAYERLVAHRSVVGTDYFPLYRAGELG